MSSSTSAVAVAVLSRMACSMPRYSSMASRFMRRAMSSTADCTGSTLPCMISSIAACASSRFRSSLSSGPVATFWMQGRMTLATSMAAFWLRDIR